MEECSKESTTNLIIIAVMHLSIKSPTPPLLGHIANEGL